MTKKVQDGWSVFRKDVRNVLGVVFANRPDHGNALLTFRPASLDEGI